MFYAPARRRLTVWIALLAILFGALAPAVSQALGSFGSFEAFESLQPLDTGQGGAGGLEICTAAGSKLVQLEGDQRGDPLLPQPQPSDALAHHLKNCPYCAAHAAGPALPPPTGLAFAMVGGHDVFPTLFYTAPSVQFAWSPAAPRGPPVPV